MSRGGHKAAGRKAELLDEGDTGGEGDLDTYTHTSPQVERVAWEYYKEMMTSPFDSSKEKEFAGRPKGEMYM